MSAGGVALNHLIWFPLVVVANLSKKDLTIQKKGGPVDNLAPIFTLILPPSKGKGRNKEHSGSTYLHPIVLGGSM